MNHFMTTGKGDELGHKLHARRITEEETFFKSLQKYFESRR